MFRGAASTSSTLLYTVPAATTAVVTNITICNTASAGSTTTILIDDIAIVDDLTVAANTTASIDMRQVINTTGTIKGLSNAVTVNYHISGLEITA